MFLSEKTPLLAIDIGSNSIKLAQLIGSKNKLELNAFGVMPLEPEAVEDGIVKDEEQVVDALTRLVKAEKVDTRYAVSSVAGEAVIIKKIKVPMMTDEELSESISHEAEQYIPFDIDDVQIDYQVLEGVAGGDELHDFEEDEEEKQEIILVAVQNEIIDSRSDVLRAAGLKPVVMDLDVFATVNALSISRNLEEMGSVAIIDLGGSFTHVSILMDGVSSFTRDIPIGGNTLTEKLQSQYELEYRDSESMKLGLLPESVAKDEVVELIVTSFEPILDEIQKSFEFFSTTSNSQVEQAFLCGGGAIIPGLDGLMSDRLGLPVEIFDPMESIKVNSRKFDAHSLARMAPIATVAVGLARRRFDYL